MLNMRGPRIEPLGIPVKISIHSLIVDPIFILAFDLKINMEQFQANVI